MMRIKLIFLINIELTMSLTDIELTMSSNNNIDQYWIKNRSNSLPEYWKNDSFSCERIWYAGLYCLFFFLVGIVKIDKTM